MQALVVDKNGVIYAATNPDGKVYKIEHIAGPQCAGEECNGQSQSASELDFLRLFRSRQRNTSGIWRSTTPAISMSPPAITAKSSESPPKASTRSSSRAMKPTSACWRSTAKGNLIAGSDGSGLVYRIAPDGEGIRSLQRAQERNHRAGARPRRKHLRRGVGEKRPGRAPSNFPLRFPPQRRRPQPVQHNRALPF